VWLEESGIDVDYFQYQPHHYLEMNAVGDFLGVAKLAWTVYNGYKDAPGDFRNLSNEINSLHNIVNSDILTAKNLTSEEHEKLGDILQECTNVLKDLDNLLTKYKRLGSPEGSSLRALERAERGQEDIVELKARLTSNTTLLNTFVTRYLQLPVLLLVIGYPEAKQIFQLPLPLSYTPVATPRQHI